MAAHKKETFSELTQIAIDAAIHAGEILKAGFQTNYRISKKDGRHNLVTEYDHKSEASILSYIQKRIPNSSFLAEESGATGKSDLVWIVDPLDGTVNFAHHIPVFSVSIALEIESELNLGVIYQPITEELFVAQKGKGAFLGGKRISVSSIDNLPDSILCTGFPYNLQENPHHCIDHFVDILKHGIPIRRMGSAAIDLAYLAAGRFEGFFEVGLSPWDSAAGILMVQEAGGVVSNWDESLHHHREMLPILATNGIIHKDLSKILRRPI